MTIIVTDHALIRYLERVGDYDIEEIRQQMVTPVLEQMVKLVGDTGKYPVGDSKNMFVLQNGRVVSVVPK